MKSSADKTSSATPVLQGDKKPFIQKKSSAGFITPVVQPKLKVGKPNDPFEKEAEHISEKITERAPAPLIQKKCKTCEEKEKEIQKCCDKDTLVQRMPNGDPAVSHSSSVETSLASSKGKGHPISDPVKSTMESGFGTSFSHVKIHTDSSAVSMSQNLQAQAFTHGQDIYFNKGKYNPTTTDGKSLLAHELTHTLQQGGGTQRKPLEQNAVAPEIQTEEEEVDLKKELEDSNQAAREAIDPGPARKSRASAVAIQTENNQKAKKKHSGKKGGDKKLPKKGVLSAEAKKAKAAAMALKEEAFKKTLGPVGKALSEASSFACTKADQKSDQLATNEKTHDDETKKQEKTEQAVVPPVEEGQAMSNQEQVQQLDNAAPPQPDKENARRTLQDSLSNAMPKNISEINAFESKGKAQVIGNQVLGNVSEEVGKVQDKYNDIEQPHPPKPTEEPTELPPNEVAPPTGALNIGKGAVPSLQPEHSDTKEFESKSDDLLAKENIPEEQLEMVDKGDLAEVNKGRKDLKKKVAEEPVKIKEEAKKETLQVEKGLQQEEAKGKSDMRTKRTKGLDLTKDKQTKTKTELEKKREAVTAHIQGIYNRAKKSVTDKLSNLEKQNLKDFDSGQHTASVQFEYEVKRDIDAWKSDRYSGLFGGVRWLKDKFVGIDHFPEVQQALTRGRENYVRRIDELIVSIDKANQLVITQCKAELALAQVEIAQYVKNLGPELKATGQAAMKDMKAKLAEMDKYIDDQKNKLREKLCSKREEAIKAIDKRIEQMKEEMSGLLSKLGNLILDALIKFFKWALEKAGYSPQELMKIINTGRAVIKKIVTSPGGFFSNLAKAVKGGVNNFKKNIEQHLIKGMLGWLTGAMSDSGLQLPTTWDVKGILFLLLQILGLTKEMILKKLSDKVGKPVVEAAMKVAGFVKRVVDEGPGALWEMLKEQAESLKEKVLTTVRNWVSLEMIKQGIIKLVSMLNPVGAIVQLIIGIYNAVMFFIENWSRIVEFVKTIFGSIADIAFGRLGPAMDAVERALGMTIPIILNFLARMLGLSGIGKAIKKAIDAIRAPIDRIVDKGLEAMAKLIKPLVEKGKQLVDKGKEKATAIKEKILAWWKARKKFKGKDGTSHELYFKGDGNKADFMVASNPMKVDAFLGIVKKQIDAMPAEEKADKSKAEVDYNTALKLDIDINTLQTKLAQANTGDAAKKDVIANQTLFEELKGKLDKLGDLLGNLMALQKTATPIPPPILPPFSNNVRGQSFKARYLSANNNVPAGEESSKHVGNLGEWEELIDKGTRERDNFVRMHLLHHKLGGRATDSNLTPAKSVINSDFYRTLELPALQESGLLTGTKSQTNKVIWYSVSMNYHSGDKLAENFIKSIKSEYGYHDKTQNWKEDTKAKATWSATPGIPEHGTSNKKYVINEDGKTALRQMKIANKSFSEDFIVLLVTERNESLADGKKKAYSSLPDLSVRLESRIKIQKLKPGLKTEITTLSDAVKNKTSKIFLNGSDG